MLNTMFILLLLGGLVGLLCVGVGIFLLYKRYGDNAIQVTLGGFGEIKTSQSGLVLIFFGLFLFTFSSYSYAQARKVEELKSQLNSFMITTAKNLRREFHSITDNQKPPIAPEAFNHVNFLIGVLQQIDQDNGHGFYYTGEVKLWEGTHLKDVRQDFFRYIEVLDSIPESEKGGATGALITYERPRGFSRQRSGWIHNLLANDFFAEAMTELDSARKLLVLELARQQIAASLSCYPVGFLQSEYPPTLTQIIPTKVLQQNIDREIEALKPKK
jgi:hypothetical protein